MRREATDLALTLTLKLQYGAVGARFLQRRRASAKGAGVSMLLLLLQEKHQL